MLSRPPGPLLRPFVQTMWASEVDASLAGAQPGAAPLREHVLPTGDMHLVLRLSGPPLRLFDSPTDFGGRTVGHAIVGGARSVFYARDVGAAACSVGAQLRPGAARALLGPPAGELAERHTPLDALWGDTAVQAAMARVQAAGTVVARLAAFEALLVERLRRCPPQGMHPAIAQALGRLGGWPIGELVDASGLTHRRFIALVRDAAGLAPKRLARVRRLQHAIAAWHAGPPLPWAEFALAVGYSDQPHFQRDFLEITGLTPQAYVRAAPAALNHVPVAGVNFLQDTARADAQNRGLAHSSKGGIHGHP